MTLTQIREETQIPAVLADHQGLFQYVNAPFEEVFGWGRAEVLGRPLTLLIPKVLHDAHHLGFSRFLMTGQGNLVGRPLKLTAITRGLQELPIELLIVAERRHDQWAFGATLRPLSALSAQAQGKDGLVP